MKNILVPLGLSDLKISLSSLAYAIQMAKETGGKVYVAKEFKELPRTGSLPSANNALKDIAIAEIEKEIAKIGITDLEVIALAIEEDLLEGIPAFNLEHAIDLLVLGTESLDIANPYFLGEKSGSLVKKTEIPVLVVPENYKYKAIKKVLMAIKSGVIKKENALAPVQDILTTFSAELGLLQVKTSEFTPEDAEINADLKKMMNSYKTTENATLFQGVLEHLNDNNPDLLCVFRRKRGFFEQLWENNTILKRDFESRIPLLILRGAD